MHRQSITIYWIKQPISRHSNVHQTTKYKKLNFPLNYCTHWSSEWQFSNQLAKVPTTNHFQLKSIGDWSDVVILYANAIHRSNVLPLHSYWIVQFYWKWIDTNRETYVFFLSVQIIFWLLYRIYTSVIYMPFQYSHSLVLFLYKNILKMNGKRVCHWTWRQSFALQVFLEHVFFCFPSHLNRIWNRSLFYRMTLNSKFVAYRKQIANSM